jgi:hypothetical protein
MRPALPELERMPVSAMFKPRSDERDLFDILCDIGLGLLPYERHVVEAYKVHMVENDLPFLRRKFSLKTLGLLHSISFVSFVACYVVTIVLLVMPAFRWEVMNMLKIGIPGVCLSCGLLGVVVFTNHALKCTPGTWVRENLTEYLREKELPDLVHETAIAVSKKIPQGQLFVESFSEDPFLVLHYKGKDYYLEVWGEEAFRPSRGS